jgi:hypothetical protein
MGAHILGKNLAENFEQIQTMQENDENSDDSTNTTPRTISTSATEVRIKLVLNVPAQITVDKKVQTNNQFPLLGREFCEWMSLKRMFPRKQY